MKKSVFLTALFPIMAMANDSTGTIGTGGIEYLKNDKIAMQTEDLYISPKQIKVQYQYKNLTDKDVTETVLFPLPRVEAYRDMPFADTTALVDSFKIFANGQEVKPQVNVRAFMMPIEANGTIIEDRAEDVTEALIACGLTQQELLNPWTNKLDHEELEKKVATCDHAQIRKLGYKPDNKERFWSAELIYSWQQTFKANEITKIEHSYTPLVGGGVGLGETLEYTKEMREDFCATNKFANAIKKSTKNTVGAYEYVDYVVKTGANWAKPIEQFNLTVEAADKQGISFCWKGSAKNTLKGGQKIQISESNFTPKEDLLVLFPFLKD